MNECAKQKTKLLDQLTFLFRCRVRDVYAPKCTFNFYHSSLHLWMKVVVALRGEAMNTSDRLTFYGAKFSFLLRYPLSKHHEVQSEFIAIHARSVFMNDWGINRMTFG